MRERLATAGGALLALAAIFAVAISERGPTVTYPTAEQAGPNGYFALNRWLQESGVRTVSYRYPALELDEHEAGAGNLFITAMPHRRNLASGEADALRAWVAGGNTLLISVALDDTPAWAMGAAPRLLDQLEELAGLRFSATQNVEVVLPWGTPATIALEPRRGEAMAGVSALQGETDGPTSMWRASVVDDGAWRPLAHTAEYDTEAIWHRRYGHGDIYVVALGSLLTNRAIAQADNARFFANVAAEHLAADGAAIFDDFHQGLSMLYDPNAFFEDPRLHISALCLLALWLLYMVGTWNRLAPPQAEPEVPGQLDFVRAAGGLLARKLHRSDAARLLFAARFGHMAGRGATFAEPPWQRLAEDPTVPSALATALRQDYRRAAAGHRVPLVQLRNRLLATTASSTRQPRDAASAGDPS